MEIYEDIAYNLHNEKFRLNFILDKEVKRSELNITAIKMI